MQYIKQHFQKTNQSKFIRTRAEFRNFAHGGNSSEPELNSERLHVAGFSLGCLHIGEGGNLSPLYGGTSAGGQSVNGGLMRWDIDLRGGPNFDRLYHKLRVLLLLSCNYTMRLIILLSNSHSNEASIQKNWGDKLHCVIVPSLILL